MIEQGEIALVLASGSAARKNMLCAAGLDFDVVPADIDEGKIKDDMVAQGAGAAQIALSLAKEKAEKISRQKPEKYIIGSDQVLTFGDRIYDKAKDKKEARTRLQKFQGGEHFLTSAVCVYKNGQYLWHKTDAASLKMHSMNDPQIDQYIEQAGDIVTQCVGCYAIEGIGLQLFHDIRGDYFTILGMPLLPLLTYIRALSSGAEKEAA